MLSDIGQGSKTALSQLAAKILGILPEKIAFISGDTRITPYDEGTGSSRTIFPRPMPAGCLRKGQRPAFDIAGRMLMHPRLQKILYQGWGNFS